MRHAVAAAVLVIVLFALTAPRLTHRLPPALATRVMVPASLATAASTMFVLGLLAFTWLGQLPPIAALGPWSTTRLDQVDPVPDPLAAISLVLLAATTAWAGFRITRRVSALLAVCRICRELRSPGQVVVLDSAHPDAFATPAPAGRIVVTAGLWRALTPAERRVVLAHERSHLSHRHTWWTLAADFAAAVNPLLRPLATAVGHAVERWADEDAARDVGNRDVVARTIARTALLQHAAYQPDRAGAAAATGGDVPRRVRALLAPPPRQHPLALAALTGLLLAGVLATMAVERSGDRLFDQASARPHHATIALHGLHHLRG